ncbi:hypothetical protein MY10362_006049 [Beauveria mimosiformis]
MSGRDEKKLKATLMASRSGVPPAPDRKQF